MVPIEMFLNCVPVSARGHCIKQVSTKKGGPILVKVVLERGRVGCFYVLNRRDGEMIWMM